MIKEAFGTGVTNEEAIEAAKTALDAPWDADVQVELTKMAKKKTLGLFGGSLAEARAYYEIPDEVKKEVKKAKTEAKPKPQKNIKKQEAVKRMRQLNMQIEQVDGLGKNYQIGAAYFLKLRTVAFEALWSDYLEPLLQEYINGMPMEKELMKKFRNAYDLKGETGESEDEDA